MYFYCYNIECYCNDVIYLYGRLFDTENMENLKNIGKCTSKPIKITVDTVISPVIAVFNPASKDINLLIDDLKTHFKGILNLEEITYTNIFYDDIPEQIKCVKIICNKKLNLSKFESNHCLKIFNEFSSPLETFIISKKIRLPCILKLKTERTFITIDDIEGTIKSEIPNLNYASLDMEISKNNILTYNICANRKKYYYGSTKMINSLHDHTIYQIDYFRDSYTLTKKIMEILENENIDVLIYHNLHQQHVRAFTKFIKCDLYVFASGNIKCRSFSLEDIAKYFKMPYSGINDPQKTVELIYDLFFASDALLLAKELSELSGFNINKVLNNNRAEIIEYALMHDLYDKKYLLPPIKDQTDHKYTGGLVLEPKKKYTDTIVSLLDFNSLYPSIIQEYNVCFSNKEYDKEKKGVLPKIITNLKNRRNAIKKLLKEDETNKIYNIRQQALKILANSIYGCLGFSKSRFCDYKMAAFITEKGREILNKTKNIIEKDLGYDVIYGDTDSIMVDTKLKYTQDNIQKSRQISERIKKRINEEYEYIELDTDKTFIKLYLYAKKKYVGVYIDKDNNFKEEYKGVDLVRRDFCKAAGDIIGKVYSILLRINSDTNLDIEIYNLLTREFTEIKNRPPEDYIINNVLSKPVEEYAENIPLAHIQLCRRLRENGIVYNSGDMVSYIIGTSNLKLPFYKRAFLEKEKCQIDYDYYISSQILPSLKRILEPVDFINIGKVHQIFKKPFEKTSISRVLKFITPCCNNLQVPDHYCTKCNKEIDEKFYLKKVAELLHKEIDFLYSTKMVCEECKSCYDGSYLTCSFCNKELEYEIKNDEFDKFLDDLLIPFSKLDYKKVTNYIKQYMTYSAYRIFDISIYFEAELKAYKEEIGYKKE